MTHSRVRPAIIGPITDVGPASVDTTPGPWPNGGYPVDAHDLTTLTPEQIERFWSLVDKSAGPGDCWAWTGNCDSKGYGRFCFGGHRVGAHRVAYVLVYGPIPPDLPCICHRCDNPPCCNPACLFAGTHADNAADREAKGRGDQPSGDRHGRRTKPDRTSRGERHAARMRAVAARGERNGARLFPERLARGSRQGLAKLTEADIPGIRIAVAAMESKAEIARRYGVSDRTIRDVANGKTWKHVPHEATP